MKNRKFKQVILFETALILFLVLLVSIFNLSTNKVAFAEEKSEFLSEKRLYSKATLSSDFENDSLIVIMDKDHSEINKPFNKNGFSNISYYDAVDLTFIEGNVKEKKYLNQEEFHQIFKIILKEKSQANFS